MVVTFLYQMLKLIHHKSLKLADFLQKFAFNRIYVTLILFISNILTFYCMI